MRIYLDNNIIVSIEQNEIDIESLHIDCSKISYVYSDTHIKELLEASNKSLEDIRISSIERIMKNQHIYSSGVDSVGFEVEKPEVIITSIRQFSALNEMIRNMVINFNMDRKQIVDFLNIDEKQINNYTSSEVISYLNTLMNDSMRVGLQSYLNQAGTSLRDNFNTLFNFLDWVGFWKDKKTDRSNLARTYDASHVYFGSFCDCFVSNDKRARNKANVAYSLYGINNSVILSFDEYLEYIKSKDAI